MDNNFGKILLDARLAADLTQKELAEMASISVSYVGAIENSRPHTTSQAPPKPNRDKIIRVVNVLNTKLPMPQRLDLNKLLKMVGHAGVDDESNVMTFALGEKASIKLELPPEEAKEIAEEMSLMYDVAMARRRARNGTK